MRPVGGAGGGRADLGSRSEGEGGMSGAAGGFDGLGGAELTSCCGGVAGSVAAGPEGELAERVANASPIMPPRMTMGRLWGARFFGLSSPMEATFSIAIGCCASTMAMTEGLTLTNLGSSAGAPPKRSKLGIGMAACCVSRSPAAVKEPDSGLPRTIIDGLSVLSNGSSTTKDDAFAAFVAQKANNMVAKTRRIETPGLPGSEPNCTACGPLSRATLRRK